MTSANHGGRMCTLAMCAMYRAYPIAPTNNTPDMLFNAPMATTYFSHFHPTAILKAKAKGALMSISW